MSIDFRAKGSGDFVQPRAESLNLQGNSRQFLKLNPLSQFSTRFRNRSSSPFYRLQSSRSRSTESSLKAQYLGNQSAIGTPSTTGTSIGSASNLGNLGGKSRYTRKDTVAANSSHYLKFNIADSTRVTLSLNGLSDDANLQLLRGSGGVVGSSARPGNRSEAIRSKLQPGIYYIQITGAGSSSVNYNLSLVAAGKTSDAGNATSSALDAGNLNQTQRRYKGKLSRDDTADFFRFDLSQADDVSFAVGGLRQNADLKLFNSSGAEISRAANDGSTSRTIGQRLDAGTYFLGVSGNSSATLRYTLDMSGIGQVTSLSGTGSSSGSTTSSGNPGGSLSSAETVSSPTFSRNQSVDGTNRSDFYRFTVNQAGVFTGNLSGLSGDADVRLIQDANNNGQIDQNEVLAWQWEWGTANESIRRFIQPGTYYVQVAGYGSQPINYQVDSNFSPSGSDDRKFSIQLNFGNGLDAINMGVKNAISDAAKFWENVISSSSFNGLHALKIDVVGMNTSERWLASATNRTGQIAANGKWMPVTGDVRVNTSYAQTYNNNPSYLRDIVIHEFGHVLGIGSLWEKNGNALVDRSSSTYKPNTYAGKAYAELNNSPNPISVPVEPNVFGHWDENKLGNELLTPFAEREGTKMPLSKLTIASLRDMGWNVNYGAAQSFSMSDAQSQSILPGGADPSVPDLATVNGYPLYACRCPYCAGAKKALGLNLTGSSKLESAVRKSRNQEKERARNKTRSA